MQLTTFVKLVPAMFNYVALFSMRPCHHLEKNKAIISVSLSCHLAKFLMSDFYYRLNQELFIIGYIKMGFDLVL